MSKPTEAAADRFGRFVFEIVLKALESSHADEIQPVTRKIFAKNQEKLESGFMHRLRRKVK